MPPTECIYQVSNWYLKACWRKVRKTRTDGRTDGRTDRRTDGRTLPRHNTSRFSNGRIKTQYRNRLPWLTEGLKLSIKHKNKLYRTSLKHPTEYNITIYKNYRNKLTSLLKIEENNFYQNQITSNKNNLRKVWAIIKNVINKNKSKKKSDQFISNNKKITNPNEIANGFNDYFVNIGPTLIAKITSEGPSYKIFMHNDYHMSFFIDPANEGEIINIISHLKEGAPGRDEIVARNLKCISDSIAYPLAQIANLSFQQGVFPEELKIAAVTPLYKAKDPMMFNNYRPISLISVFAKILERLMYNRLLKFINKHQIFNKHQFGFRDKHSTFMALIILLENLVNAIDNGKCAVGIFLDFQKAFDTVDHCILLDKLYFYGIRGQAFDWFSSYLHNRQQLVNYCGCESDLKSIKCGVPKGSILGPLLFLLYINDLPQVSEYFMPILFADDTNLFATGYNLNDIVSEINKEIANIYAWVKANKLSLNIDKTNFMLFTPKCEPRTIKDIFIDGNKIVEVTETRFLGVIIDCKLNWSPHITYISKKVAKGVGIIIKARKLFDQETLLTLYYTFVYPYLNYCIHVWGKAYNVHIHDLIVLQNKAVRIVHGVSPRTNADKLYFDHNILSLKRLYSYNIGIFMYKFSKNMLPELFDNFFCNVASVHEHNTRSACLNHIYVKFKGTTRGQKAFSYSGACIWNLILSRIETDCAIGTFKKFLAKLLLNSKEDLLSTWILINVVIPPH